MAVRLKMVPEVPLVQPVRSNPLRRLDLLVPSVPYLLLVQLVQLVREGQLGR